MTRPSLPRFDAPPPTADTAPEEERLAAYEQGYSAGWDDAVAAQEAEVTKLRGDLGRNLQELSFTYHEARSHVLRAVEPLLAEMVGKLLPAVARQSLGAMVVEALRPLAEDLADTPVEVTVHPASRAAVEAMLTRDPAPPLRIVEEPSLGEGQVYLRLGRIERRVDLDGIVAAIDAALAAFFHPQPDPEPLSDG